MARRINQFRRKPAGWRGESWRHYMAAKGMKTTPNRYFVLDEFKGNRTSSELHRAHAKGFSKEDLKRDGSARSAFGVSLEELSRKRRKSSFPEDLSQSEEVASSPLVSRGEPLPDTTTPESAGEGVGIDFQGTSATDESLVMSPGVPPAPPGTDAGFFAKKLLFERAIDVVDKASKSRRDRDLEAAAKIEEKKAESEITSTITEDELNRARLALPTSAAERQDQLNVKVESVQEKEQGLEQGTLSNQRRNREKQEAAAAEAAKDRARRKKEKEQDDRDARKKDRAAARQEAAFAAEEARQGRADVRAESLRKEAENIRQKAENRSSKAKSKAEKEAEIDRIKVSKTAVFKRATAEAKKEEERQRQARKKVQDAIDKVKSKGKKGKKVDIDIKSKIISDKERLRIMLRQGVDA